ncbi:hypothetical protein PV10_05016 [Exophiala mesophila]|uniref:Acyltransferase 3 domain-containing protein n=1 Tax=Exophiala mesophila TaxID=212818 RepID=A0A0D1WWR1_EXOME|nr:uncharacterized protein PV10_05016 [Exophiala mesophila]KIV93830.1 hypothetical protein PV10_05016 [Exophiala mesophila]
MEVSLRDELPKHDHDRASDIHPAMTILTHVKHACADYLQPSMWFNMHRRGNKVLGRTAYLDGLRGFAALLVYCLHHQVWGHSGTKAEFILENAYGWDRQFYFACLPGIRLFFSGGHLAVAVFFVISGFVLSAKPLSLIHAGETGQLSDNLGSALFRRWLRLFIPVIGTTFVWMTSWHLFGIKSSNPASPEPEKKYIDELWNWYAALKNYSFVFHEDPAFAYNDHTWSIALEFKGSIIVYTALLALARCRRNARLAIEAGMVFYFLYIVDGWYCALFSMGMLLCDLDLLALKDELPSFFYHLKPHKNTILYVLLAIGLYLGGVPSMSEDIKQLRDSPGWYYLSFLKPQAIWDFRWFYRFWAATCLIISISYLPTLKSFFELGFCQYLGKVSFGFYLVHGPVLWTLGDRIYAAVGRVREGHAAVVPGWVNLCPLPSFGPMGLEFNLLMAHVVLFPVTLWFAEVVTKVFDNTSVRISQGLYKKTKETGDRPDAGSKRDLWEKV